MAHYFTDTMPLAQVQLGDYTRSVLGDLPDMNKPKDHSIEFHWTATDINYQRAHSWYRDSNPINVFLKGAVSMSDFETSLMGNASNFANPPNRTSGDPIVLKPGDVCMVMHRQEPQGILRWKVIAEVEYKDGDSD